ncbi:DHHC zinc finger domain containing protein [Zea mays]|uniref:S-acyltransferase n=1 Tax=Zea mays TaxID=4577 RepID=A0A1D6DTM0_MAIZE|nr:DHHC zinc finger domain containing protein [Zea mays]
MAEPEREQRPLLEVEQSVTSIPEDHEATCWGCGLRLVFAGYSPIYKCGWCGAITQSNQTTRKPDSVWFSHWRRVRDRFFVTVLILFMLFVICGGVWAVYPIVFKISNFCGIFHCMVTAVLAVFTITSYCLASSKSAGAPTNIGNCVGASNHQVFVIFLISVVISCSYAAGMTIYASYQIWPSVDFPNLASSRDSMSFWKIWLEIITTVAGSAFFLSARGLVLVYLAFASLSVNAEFCCDTRMLASCRIIQGQNFSRGFSDTLLLFQQLRQCMELVVPSQDGSVTWNHDL